MKWPRELFYSLPLELQNAVLVKRRSPVWLRTGIVFVHIPKAAGTSISDALYGRFMGHIPASSITCRGSDAVKALPSFAITRNPWDRLVSAFRYGRRLHTSDWKLNDSVPYSVRRQVPVHENFESFVMEWLQETDVRKLNQIYQPQAMFVCDSQGAVLVDHVGRIENLAPTYEFIARHHEPITQLERTNPSGEPVDYRQFYTPELADIVGRIYAQDVHSFGYAFG